MAHRGNSFVNSLREHDKEDFDEPVSNPRGTHKDKPKFEDMWGEDYSSGDKPTSYQIQDDLEESGETGKRHFRLFSKVGKITRDYKRTRNNSRLEKEQEDRANLSSYDYHMKYDNRGLALKIFWGCVAVGVIIFLMYRYL